MTLVNNSTEMEYLCVTDNFRVIILELNYIGQKDQVIVLDCIAKVVVIDYIAKVVVIDYIAKVVVIDYIAKVIVIMITIAITYFTVHTSVSRFPMLACFLFILYIMHAPGVYFNSA